MTTPLERLRAVGNSLREHVARLRNEMLAAGEDEFADELNNVCNQWTEAIAELEAAPKLRPLDWSDKSIS